MDVLTDVLESIRARSLMLGRFELTAPWGLSFEPTHGSGLAFLLVTRGRAVLETGGSDRPLWLAGGDFVLVQKHQMRTLRDSLETPVVPADDLMKAPNRQRCQPGGVFTGGGGGAPTTIVGGRFEIENSEHNPLLRALPAVIHVRGEQGPPASWLETTLQFVSAEMASGQPGASTVVARLADVLLVQAVRTYLTQCEDGRGGWLRALVDPHIGPALSLIHAQPDAPWTVQTLAGQVAMSRSGFSARFTELVGEPPLTYLTRWRMAHATQMLHRSSATVGEVAASVGYDAGAAFSKAFKRWNGLAPAEWRRRSRTSDGQDGIAANGRSGAIIAAP